MRLLKGIPAFRMLLPSISGIVLVYYCTDYLIQYQYHVLILSVLIFGMALIVQYNIRYGFRWLPGLLISSLFFLVFMYISLSNQEIFNPNHFAGNTELDKTGYYARISDAVSEKLRTFKTILEIEGVDSSGVVKQKMGKILVYFKKNEEAKKLQYGDLIFCKVGAQPIPEPNNPHQFNLRKYLALKQVHHQVYLSDQDWILVDNSHHFSIKGFALSFREKMIKQLNLHGLEGNQFSVASAILLGYDDKLDADLRSEYSGSGAMHVLCVSGLHLGIIYMIIGFLLGFLNRKKSHRVIKMVLVLIMIWAFAVLTGFGPSVRRSAIMFSIMIIGETMRFSKDSFNTLSVAAFLILLFDPYALFDTGFQLSFGAVLSILLFQKPLSGIWSPNNSFIKYFWDLITVSLAAQIGTSPIAMYYFNQFPNYFLITNMIVIPLSFMILSLGFGFFLLSWLPILSDLLASLLSFIIKVMNASVSFVEQLPGSKITGIVISGPELLLLYIIIAGLLAFYFSKKLLWAYTVLISIILLICFGFYHSVLNRNLKSITVFHTTGATSLGFIQHEGGVFLSDTTFFTSRQNFEFNVQRQFWYNGVKEITVQNIQSATILPDCELYYNGSFGIFSGTSFYILNKKTENLRPSNNLKTGLLIVAGNPAIPLKEWIEKLDPECVVFASSNSPRKIKQWKSECDDMNQKSYSVTDQGAFVYYFK